MKNFTRRSALVLGGGIVGLGIGRLLPPDLANSRVVAPLAPQAAPGLSLNDASGLMQTPIHAHVRPTSRGDALVEAFRTELANARRLGRPVNIGAARHSMGGQAIAQNGIALTVDNAWIQPDPASETYWVNGGARWADVIAALDPLGYGPAVMQSNHDFGVAATFSVNAHGWPVPFGPMGSTVRALRMVLPSGELVTASRQENADLFNLAMGGYGLVGLIVDLQLDMVRNQRLSPTYTVMPASDFASAFVEAVNDPAKPMVYGRLNVARGTLFQEALLVSYAPVADQSDLPPATGSGISAHLASRIYRAQVGREGWKDWRWWVETQLAPRIAGDSTRNSLMNEPVVTLDDRDPQRVDILHEYFVPLDGFDGFLQACRDEIGDSFAEFLNVTLRYVGSDPDSVLAYAPTPRIAAVMSFTQEKTRRAEGDHQRMTQRLIDRILDLGGTYYLPYRPHARADQFQRAYPRAAEFAAAKRSLDPEALLGSRFWDTYLQEL